MNDDRPMPSDASLERKVLGQLIAGDGAGLTEIRGKLSASDFYAPHHGHLYKLLLQMADAGRPIDLVTVFDEIGMRGDAFGGTAYVAGLTDTGYATTRMLVEYAGMLVELAQRRRLVELALRLRTAVLDDDAPASELATKAAQELLAVASSSPKKRLWSFPEALDVAEQRHEDIVNGAIAPALTTGFTSGLDSLLAGGFKGGDLVIIAGPTSMGKTALALPMAIEQAKIGRDVLYVSLEMPVHQMADRARSYLTGLPGTTFLRPTNEAEEKLLAEQVSRDLGLSFLDWPGLGIADVAAEARRLRARGSLSAIFIDYLQIMSHDRERQETVAGAIGRTTKAAKQLAMELQIPVVILSQLNREYEKRAAPATAEAVKRELKGKPQRGAWWDGVALPQLHDLKESGSIEQDADVVMFPLNAERMGLPNLQSHGCVVVAKQRNGPRGIVGVLWDGKCAAYRPYGQGRFA